MNLSLENKTAIIYYCYNRVDHTKESLLKIIEYKKNLPLFIFCDGPKKEGDLNVESVREFVNKKKELLINTEIIFRGDNLGLAPNVINGVNDVFNKGYGSVIVLEDDCVPKKYFFDYMTKSLSFYESYNKVMHVTGFGIPIKTKIDKDSYISPYPCSWGWGTWKNRWENCDFEDINYYKEILSDKYLKEQFDWSGKSFSNFLELQLQGKVNSWLIRWYAHIFKKKGVCMWATDSKLENIGFDGTGQHSVRFDRFNQKNNLEKRVFNFEDKMEFKLSIIEEFNQFFMGPKLINKIKTIIFMYSGIIIDRIKDKSEYYNK